MHIIFSPALRTYVAHDDLGLVLGIYAPEEHGTVEEFRHRMTEAYRSGIRTDA